MEAVNQRPRTSVLLRHLRRRDPRHCPSEDRELFGDNGHVELTRPSTAGVGQSGTAGIVAGKATDRGGDFLRAVRVGIHRGVAGDLG
jgi:hypothetical protein